MDDRLFRNAMGRFATGITVVTTLLDGKEVGMTANAFMSVSLDPKLVVVSISKKAKMHKKIKKTKKYAISILNKDQQYISAIFAGQIKEKRNIEFEMMNNMPVIPESLVMLTCNVVTEYNAGDHTLFLGEVTDIVVREGDPLVFFGGDYRKLATEENLVR